MREKEVGGGESQIVNEKEDLRKEIFKEVDSINFLCILNMKQ